MPLAAPTLSISVDDDGVVTATIGNSNVASTNTLFRTVANLTPNPVWVEVDDRTGNGDITDEPGDGSYYYYVQTEFDDESNVSSLVKATVPSVPYLTDLPSLKAYLGISQSNTAEDTLLNLLIQSVSEFIEEYCGRKFALQEYTEFYCGNNQPYLPLNQRPVAEITELYVDDRAYWGQSPDAFSSETLKVEGEDYALDKDQPNGTSRSGLVFWINGQWPVPFNYSPGVISSFIGSGAGNIKVIYEAGYAIIPAPLQMACNLAIAKIRNTKTYGQALTSERDEVYQYSLSPVTQMSIFSSEVLSILARYKNQAVA